MWSHKLENGALLHQQARWSLPGGRVTFIKVGTVAEKKKAVRKKGLKCDFIEILRLQVYNNKPVPGQYACIVCVLHVGMAGYVRSWCFGTQLKNIFMVHISSMPDNLLPWFLQKLIWGNFYHCFSIERNGDFRGSLRVRGPGHSQLKPSSLRAHVLSNYSVFQGHKLWELHSCWTQGELQKKEGKG